MTKNDRFKHHVQNDRLRTTGSERPAHRAKQPAPNEPGTIGSYLIPPLQEATGSNDQCRTLKVRFSNTLLKPRCAPSAFCSQRCPFCSHTCVGPSNPFPFTTKEPEKEKVGPEVLKSNVDHLGVGQFGAAGASTVIGAAYSLEDMIKKAESAPDRYYDDRSKMSGGAGTGQAALDSDFTRQAMAPDLLDMNFDATEGGGEAVALPTDDFVARKKIEELEEEKRRMSLLMQQQQQQMLMQQQQQQMLMQQQQQQQQQQMGSMDMPQQQMGMNQQQMYMMQQQRQQQMMMQQQQQQQQQQRGGMGMGMPQQQMVGMGMGMGQLQQPQVMMGGGQMQQQPQNGMNGKNGMNGIMANNGGMGNNIQGWGR